MSHQLSEITPEDIDLEKLSSTPPEEFDCDGAEQNEFFKNHALKDQQSNVSVTYVAIVDKTVAGFVALTMDEIPLYAHERPQDCRFGYLPALKLAQLGVDKKFAKRGLGKILVAFAVTTARELSEIVGCRCNAPRNSAGADCESARFTAPIKRFEFN
jgi:GNAT superfamily N-acetyltransferase